MKENIQRIKFDLRSPVATWFGYSESYGLARSPPLDCYTIKRHA